MKKFLAFMCVLLVILSFGLLTVYLLKDDEDLKLNVSKVYYNEGETITVDFEIVNKKQSSKLTYSSSDPSVVEITSDNKIIAKAGGEAVITGTLKNASKQVKRTLSHLVKVGNGSETSPFYIREEAELGLIGKKDSKFTLDKHYVQTSNITLTKEWSTIAGVFTGSYNGLGHEISGLKVTGAKTSTSLFETLSQTAKVGYLTFNKVDIKGEFENASVVAVQNSGIIDYVTVSGTLTNEKNGGTTAGIVNKNIYDRGYLAATAIENVKSATVSRCTNKLSITVTDGTVGGIAAYNNSTIYACVNGGKEATEGLITFKTVSTKAIVGGLVGTNEFNDLWKTDFEKFVGKKPIVADSYSIGKIVVAADPSTGKEPTGFVSTFVGGIIGKNINGSVITLSDVEGKTNYVFGNYYALVGENAAAISPTKLYNKGIGNGLVDNIAGKYSTIEVANGDSTNVDYIAAGVENGKLIDNGRLISYQKNGDTKMWSNNIWGFYAKNYPMLLETTNFNFQTFDISLPVLFLEGGMISTATQFESIAFSEKKYSGINNYTIKNDLDFTGKRISSKVNVISNLEGLKVNGKYPVIKNLTINVVNAMNKKAYGLFADAKNIRIKNLVFENLTIEVQDNETSIENFGMLIGDAENCKIENVIIKKGIVITTSTATNIGSFVGNANNVEVSNCEIANESTIIFGSKPEAKIGGAIGNMTNSSSINNSVINMAIGVTGESSYVGGICGSLNDSDIISCKVTTSLSGTNIGGVSGIITSGNVNKVDCVSNLKGDSQSAGCSIIGEGSTKILDSKFTTIFENGTGLNVGFVGNFTGSSEAERIIIANNFKAGTQNYSKTINKPKLDFTGAVVNRNYNSDTTATMLNCFYNDKYAENVTAAVAHLIMEKNKGILGTGAFGDDWRFDKKKKPDIDYGGRFNTTYGTGRIGDNGQLITNPKKNNYKYFGFIDSDWDYTDIKSIPSLKI